MAVASIADMDVPSQFDESAAKSYGQRALRSKTNRHSMAIGIDEPPLAAC
jgi:hypothetical protein